MQVETVLLASLDLGLQLPDWCILHCVHTANNHTHHTPQISGNNKGAVQVEVTDYVCDLTK